MGPAHNRAALPRVWRKPFFPIATMNEEKSPLLDEAIDRARPPGEDALTRFVRGGGLGRSADAAEADPALIAARAAFHAAHPFEEFDEKRRSQETPAPGLLTRFFTLFEPLRVHGGALATAAATVAITALVIPGIAPDFPDRPHATPTVVGDGVRAKGRVVPPSKTDLLTPRNARVALHFGHVSREGIRPGQEGGRYRDGDHLRFSYSTTSLTHVYVISIDDQGHATPFYPDDWSVSEPVPLGRNLPLEGGIRLDDYVGIERFIAIFSRHPLQGDAVRRAAEAAISEAHSRGGDARDAGPLALGADSVEASVWIQKVAD